MSREASKGWVYIHHVSHPLKLCCPSVSGLDFLSCARHVARSPSWEMNFHSRILYITMIMLYLCMYNTQGGMMTIFWRKRREIGQFASVLDCAPVAVGPCRPWPTGAGDLAPVISSFASRRKAETPGGCWWAP